MRIDNNIKEHKIKKSQKLNYKRQFVSLLISQNFDTANIKSLAGPAVA